MTKNHRAGVDCDHDFTHHDGDQRKNLGDMGLLKGDWQERLAYIVDAMREMSLQTDAQEMVRSYGTRVRKLLPAARWLSREPAGARSALVPDHSVQHLDRSRSTPGSRKTGCRS